MRGVFFILILIFSFSMYAQPTSDEQLATHYYQSGDYEKATLYYEKLYKKNKHEIYYEYLLKCFLNINNYKEAEKLVKEKIKLGGTVKHKIDLGWVYEKSDNFKKADAEYQKIIQQLPKDPTVIINTSNAFLNYNKSELALETLLKGRKVLGTMYPLNIEIATLYEKLGKYEEMIQEYLNLLLINEAYIQSVQNSLNNSNSFAKSSPQNEILKRELIKYTQKYSDKKIYNEMLIWLYMQEKSFSSALTQAKAMDKRYKEDGERVLALAQHCYSNQEYLVAIEAYDYILNKGANNPYYAQAKTEILSVYKDKIVSNNDYTILEIKELKNKYEQVIAEFKNPAYTYDLQKELAMICAVYLNETDSAIQILENLIITPGIESKKIAMAKLDLGDYLVLKNEIWDASLYYSQVEKNYKYDDLGELAKFKNAKIAFYSGDFKWAKAQLDVLKGSTSKLIANDALWLSVIITDNSTIDTTEIPLQMFSKADLYITQNKNELALQTLDSILVLYPNHSLEDDILYQKHHIYSKKKDWNMALMQLEKIIDIYPQDLLGDDALYHMALIYDNYLLEKEQAMLHYQKLLENYPGSLYVVDARKRFRALRGDKIN